MILEFDVTHDDLDKAYDRCNGEIHLLGCNCVITVALQRHFKIPIGVGISAIYNRKKPSRLGPVGTLLDKTIKYRARFDALFTCPKGMFNSKIQPAKLQVDILKPELLK